MIGKVFMHTRTPRVNMSKIPVPRAVERNPLTELNQNGRFKRQKLSVEGRLRKIESFYSQITQTEYQKAERLNKEVDLLSNKLNRQHESNQKLLFSNRRFKESIHECHFTLQELDRLLCMNRQQNEKKLSHRRKVLELELENLKMEMQKDFDQVVSESQLELDLNLKDLQAEHDDSQLKDLKRQLEEICDKIKEAEKAKQEKLSKQVSQLKQMEDCERRNIKKPIKEIEVEIQQKSRKNEFLYRDVCTRQEELAKIDRKIYNLQSQLCDSATEFQNLDEAIFALKGKKRNLQKMVGTKEEEIQNFQETQLDCVAHDFLERYYLFNQERLKTQKIQYHIKRRLKQRRHVSLFLSGSHINVSIGEGDSKTGIVEVQGCRFDRVYQPSFFDDGFQKFKEVESVKDILSQIRVLEDPMMIDFRIKAHDIISGDVDFYMVGHMGIDNKVKDRFCHVLENLSSFLPIEKMTQSALVSSDLCEFQVDLTHKSESMHRRAKFHDFTGVPNCSEQISLMQRCIATSDDPFPVIVVNMRRNDPQLLKAVCEME